MLGTEKQIAERERDRRRHRHIHTHVRTHYYTQGYVVLSVPYFEWGTLQGDAVAMAYLEMQVRACCRQEGREGREGREGSEGRKRGDACAWGGIGCCNPSGPNPLSWHPPEYHPGLKLSPPKKANLMGVGSNSGDWGRRGCVCLFRRGCEGLRLHFPPSAAHGRRENGLGECVVGRRLCFGCAAAPPCLLVPMCESPCGAPRPCLLVSTRDTYICMHDA